MKQHRPNRKRRKLKPADVRQLCHEVLPVGDGEMPVKVTGWTDLRGRWTRMEAVYPNGWLLSFGFDDDGGVINVSARVRLAPIGKGLPAELKGSDR